MKKSLFPLLLTLAAIPFAAAAVLPAKTEKADKAATIAAEKLETYTKTATLGEGLFKSSLGGVDVDASGRVVVSGDKLVVCFDAAGKETARHTLDFSPGAVLAVADGIYVANPAAKSVVKLDAAGKVTKTFSGPMKSVTGLALHQKTLLVADSGGGCVHKFDAEGKSLGAIARREGAPRGSIATCCGILDISVNAKGEILVAELGAHRVSVYTIAGKRIATWGKEGPAPADFCGCCNPVSVASAKDAVIVSEKTIPRVKVYTADGSKLRAVIGLKDFAPGCSDLDLAAAPDGRIYATDEVRRAVLVFSPAK